MYLTDEFKKFAEQFFVGITEEAASQEELIAIVLRPFQNLDFRKNLRIYLDQITDEKISGEDLRKLWWSSPADTVFHDGEELRTFLRMVRDRL